MNLHGTIQFHQPCSYVKTAKLNVNNAHEQCKKALKAQFSEKKCNCKQMEEVFSNYTISVCEQV